MMFGNHGGPDSAYTRRSRVVAQLGAVIFMTLNMTVTLATAASAQPLPPGGEVDQVDAWATGVKSEVRCVGSVPVKQFWILS